MLSDILRPYLPHQTYYKVNWRDGKPKMAESYPNRRNIPERVAPLGFILAFGLNGESALTKQAELDYLLATQHAPRCAFQNQPWQDCCTPSEIAPEWQEMRENGITASSIDELREAEIDKAEAIGTPSTDIYGLNLDDTPPYEIPSRADQALMEWEKSSWLAGPCIKTHWSVTQDGRVTLILDSIKYQAGPYITHKFTAEQKKAILQEILRDAIAEHRVPTTDEVLQQQWDYERTRNLGLPPERAKTPDIRTQWDLDDPYRYQLHATDPDIHNRRPDNNWNSPWALAYDDPDDDFQNAHTTIVIAEADGAEVALREIPLDLEVRLNQESTH